MKKLILSVLALIIVFSFVSCNTSYAQSFIRSTYPAAEFSLYSAAYEENDNDMFKSAYEITDEKTLKMFNDSFIAVTEYFNVTPEKPSIKWFNNPDKTSGAIYNHNDKTIYLNTDCILPNWETAIVHEIIHFIADGNITSGIVYPVDVQGQSAIMGRTLNEGLTEYFAQKIKPFNYAECELDVYCFESHIGKAISAIVGTEKLKDLYINNSHQELKELFNKHLNNSFGIYQDDISLDAFDFFCMQVDACREETDSYLKGLRMNSIVAEVLIIAKEERKEKEVKKIINEFDNTFVSYLPYSYMY